MLVLTQILLFSLLEIVFLRFVGFWTYQSIIVCKFSLKFHPKGSLATARRMELNVPQSLTVSMNRIRWLSGYVFAFLGMKFVVCSLWVATFVKRSFAFVSNIFSNHSLNINQSKALSELKIFNARNEVLRTTHPVFCLAPMKAP